MNAIVAAALERIIADLPAGAPPTETELGYGRDLDCVSDCNDAFSEIGPTDPRIIMQGAARRLQTPRGTLLDDPEYGFDLRGLCHKALTPLDLRQLQVQTLGEVNKDQRLEPSATAVVLSYADRTIYAAIRGTPRDPRGNPFSFVVHVSEAGAEVEP